MTVARALTPREEALSEELLNAVHDAVAGVLKKALEDFEDANVASTVLEVLALQVLASHVGAYASALLQVQNMPVAACDYAVAVQMATAFDIALEEHDCGKPECDFAPKLMVQQKRYTRLKLKLERQLQGMKVPIIP